MKIKNKTRRVWHIFMAVVFGGLIILPIWGQLPLSEGRTKDSTQSDADRDLEERIAYQRMRASLAENQRKKRDPKLALAELQEDFKRIQAVNLEMVRTLSKGGTLDLKFVAGAASEIKKRAERLKENLVLPEPEKEDKPAQAETAMTLEQLKWSMLLLGKLVYGFVKSPLFTEIEVVNQQEGMKVRAMLDQIIELSQRIKKNSEHLNKTKDK